MYVCVFNDMISLSAANKFNHGSSPARRFAVQDSLVVSDVVSDPTGANLRTKEKDDKILLLCNLPTSTQDLDFSWYTTCDENLGGCGLHLSV